jgi:hypothetical protein
MHLAATRPVTRSTLVFTHFLNRPNNKELLIIKGKNKKALYVLKAYYDEMENKYKSK